MTQTLNHESYSEALACHPWRDKPEKAIEEMPTKELLLLYGMFMSTKNAKGHLINAANKEKQQFFSPELSSALETYLDLLELGVIKISSKFWPSLLSTTEEQSLDSELLINAIFEVNVKPRQSHSLVCRSIKRIIDARVLAGEDIAKEAMPCWFMLNQAYCFNSIAYRYRTFNLNVENPEFTTSEYFDLKELATQLSAGWINTLCHRAFTWSAGKQKETGMSDVSAAKLVIGSVTRQFRWALEKPPLGEMYTRPKSLIVFGLERVFNDIFGIAPSDLFEQTPDADYLQQCLIEQFGLPRSC